jgi:hypothetical protein
MPDLENPLTGLRRSRRNLIRISAIAAAAMIAKIKSAAADDFRLEHHSHGWDRDRDRDKHRDRGGRDTQCFLKGTVIRTADGDRKIEDLSAGDLLPSVFGGTCAIQWIGRYSFTKGDPTKGWVRGVLPIRIARSALCDDVPHADLYVTQTHAVLVDGVLVAAGNLVNGTTITRYDAAELDRLEYFNIKLPRHDVIYAEGAPCETLLEADESAVNFAEYLRQYGTPRIKDAWCAPRVGFGRRIEIQSRFRSAISPWIVRRHKVDIIRDKLDERGLALFRQSELVS